jgi:hypothetical protein
LEKKKAGRESRGGYEVWIDSTGSARFISEEGPQKDEKITQKEKERKGYKRKEKKKAGRESRGRI